MREALHVPSASNFFDGDNGAGMVYRSTEPDLRPFYQHVANSTALRVLVYNGDTDPAINSFVAQAQHPANRTLTMRLQNPTNLTLTTRLPPQPLPSAWLGALPDCRQSSHGPSTTLSSSSKVCRARARRVQQQARASFRGEGRPRLGQRG